MRDMLCLYIKRPCRVGSSRLPIGFGDRWRDCYSASSPPSRTPPGTTPPACPGPQSSTSSTPSRRPDNHPLLLCSSSSLALPADHKLREALFRLAHRVPARRGVPFRPPVIRLAASSKNKSSQRLPLLREQRRGALEEGASSFPLDLRSGCGCVRLAQVVLVVGCRWWRLARSVYSGGAPPVDALVSLLGQRLFRGSVGIAVLHLFSSCDYLCNFFLRKVSRLPFN